MATMDPYQQLRLAVWMYEEVGVGSGNADDKRRLIDAACRFVHTIESRSRLIEQMRQNVTPTEEALAQILGDAT